MNKAGSRIPCMQQLNAAIFIAILVFQARAFCQCDPVFVRELCKVLTFSLDKFRWIGLVRGPFYLSSSPSSS